MSLLRHLTKLEYFKVLSKLKKNDNKLARKYFKLICNYEKWLEYERWFYNSIKDYHIEKDASYYIKRHKWKHHKYDY